MNNGILQQAVASVAMPYGLLGRPRRLPLIDPNRRDVDAQRYINAVEAADRLPLEDSVKDAINEFVIQCKIDGLWPAMQAVCILMGARTLAGALVPLTGATPSNINFVSGDYDRKLGLTGNSAAGKAINTNCSNTLYPQSDHHMAVYCTTAPTNALAGIGDFSGGRVQLLGTTVTIFRHRNSAAPSRSGLPTGFIGMSRAASNQLQGRSNGGTTTFSDNASEGTLNYNFHVFARSSSFGLPEVNTNSRMTYYSLGTSINLALYDTRITALYNAIGNAIP